MKKGFTLIELLAVIAIIAVIALITAPAVIEILNDSKESAVIITAQKYSKTLSSTILTKKTKEAINPYKCTITSDGNAECYDKETGISKLIEIETTDNVSGGFIEFDENAITDYTFCIDGNSVTKDGTVNKNSTYCKNLKDPNATKYIAKFYVNNTEYKTKNNYDYLLNDYIGFVEGSNELKLPDVPLDKSVLDTYSVPVEYKWRVNKKSHIYEIGKNYTFENSDVKFYPEVAFSYTNGGPWGYQDVINYSGSVSVKGSNLYSGIKNSFHLAPGTDDYAYHMAPFLDGTTYTFEELNTTYKNTKFYAYTYYVGVDLNKVIGTRAKFYVGDYDNPTRILADEYYDVDPNSNDDFITTEITTGLGSLRPALTIEEAFPSDPFLSTYNAARVIRLIIPYDDYKDTDIQINFSYKDINGMDYSWFDKKLRF